MQAPEQCPVPCQRCGAGMAPAPDWGTARYADVIPLVCRYCGYAETLTRDDRVRVSRERVALLRMAQDAAEAPARHAEQIIGMRPWLGGVVVGGVLTLNALNGVGMAREAIERAGPAMDAAARLQALLGVCVTPLLGVGLAAGMFGGWTLAMRRYRALVTPGRWARAPLAPGAPARCRCCGAGLPEQWGAMVECGFCRTHNLLDRAVIDQREALLLSETAQHQARAAGVIARANEFSASFGHWSLVGAAAGAVVGGVLGYALALALAQA
ncbi:MAG: hypothetical protein IPF99_39540 [Deltaproteobacteria bacterium]|jgi:hypothetical protein|nr:hypothetical protein [Deltaproteobacteria bacterium]